MNMEQYFVGMPDMCLALVLSIILGFALGLEREITNKIAGLRTHMLVCIGACVFTILSIHAFPLAAGSDNPASFGDPARIAAQIITGIGFIGAGTVLKHGATVSGLTTAATLWVAAAIGMCCGTEFYVLAFLVTILTVTVLVLIRIFEREIIRKDLVLKRQMKAILLCNDEHLKSLYEQLNEKFDNILEISKKRAQNVEHYSKVTLKVDIKASAPINYVTQILNQIPNIDIIAIQESYE